MKISGYEMGCLLYESIKHRIYKAIRTHDKQKVVIKVLKETARNSVEIKKFRHEFEMGKKISSQYVVSYLEFYERPEISAIIQADDDAVDLTNVIPEKGFDLQGFLKIAIQLSLGLIDIHQQNITHKDIKPANLIIQPESNTIKYIDFGNASASEEENRSVLNPNKVEGTLFYISPEQTGRMNRSTDYRTDFYSLGMTFYQLLCGELPFDNKDPIAVIHFHLAKKPKSIHKFNTQVPEVIANIVSKLLMKNAEDRYQSGKGLLFDLEKCLDELSTENSIEPFALGQNDFSERFQLSQKLYGREQEVELLLNAFHRVSEGKPEVFVVAGYSGIGKSTLINEIQKPIALKKAYFLTGKFDQLNKMVAYSAIAQAFRLVVKQILSESEAGIQQWQHKLLSALGSNGQLVIEVIPEVEHIIGKQPPVQTIGNLEAKNRFNMVFHNFISVFANKEHPLVLFLDDLQWADYASLELIKLFITQPGTEYFLLIGAYRDNEVDDSHPAIIALEDIQKAQINLQRITLSSLDLATIQTWIAASLNISLNYAKSLAELVYQKTQGNPFFVKMFLKSLYDEKLITFSITQEWEWDLEKIYQQQVTDNVVDFMVARMNQFDDSTQSVLALAGCLGHSFTRSLLEIITRKCQEELTGSLQLIFKAGMAYQIDENIYFAHDRVQEAAYSLLTDDKKKATHLLIGRLLLENNSQYSPLENIFDIVDHLNISIELISDEQERLKLAELNLQACGKAKNAVAYTAGLNYIEAGLSCLDKARMWSEHYPLTFSLYREKAELEHSNSSFEQAEKTIELLLANAQSVIEKADVYNLLISQKTILTENQEAIQLGRFALALLEIELSADKWEEKFESENNEIKKNIADKDIRTILNMPEISDLQKRASLKLLLSLIAPTYLSNRLLYNIVTVSAVNFSIKYGCISESPNSFVFYASMLCENPDTVNLGYQFGLLAIELSEKYQNLTQKCKMLHTFSILVNPWFKSLQSCQVISNNAFQAGLNSGEMQYAGYTRYHLATLLFFRSENLFDVLVELRKILNLLFKIKHQFAIDVVNCLQDIVLNITGQQADESRAEYLSELKKRENPYALCHRAIFKEQMLCLYGRYEEALHYSLKAEKLSTYISAHYALAVHKFYYSLNLTALYLSAIQQDQEKYRAQLMLNQQALKNWAQNNTKNFRNKLLLVTAEIAHLENKPWQAGKLYDKAIAAAQSAGFIQEEALANELAGKFWLANDREAIAKSYLNQAFLLYQRWGAKQKTQLMKESYAQLLNVGVSLTSPVLTLTAYTSSLLLDMQNVIKAAQVISSEITLEKLLFNIMKIIIETAGAQKGALLLNDAGKLAIKAEYTINGQINVLLTKPIEDWEDGASSIIEYVKNTRQTVILGRALEDRQFGSDPYIQKCQLKSVLCMPLLKQNEMMGILYIENNLANFAFPHNRVEVLTILTSQMAISLENAKFFEAQLYAARQLAAESARAAAAESYKNELENFIDMICHEIRNPLSGIYGNTSFINDYINHIIALMSEDSIPAKLKEKIVNQLDLLKESNSAIKQCATHQKRIADDVLNLSRLENRKFLLDNYPFSPSATLRSAIKMFEAQITQKEIILSLALPEQEVFVQGDAKCLLQVLTNLLSNAVKFTPEQGKINVSLTIKVISASDFSLKFRIQDSGIGMSIEEKSRLFERFAQANRRTAHDYGGSGLGLVISKRLVNLMGGDIRVNSQKGHGTTFEFVIRCQCTDNLEITPEIEEAEIPARLPLTRIINILVVEDNLMNQNLLVRILNKAGYECQAVNNGKEAVEQAKNMRFDLILMDIQMPVMDGLEATRQIRLNEQMLRYKAVPIIGVSGNARNEHRKQAIAIGINSYITKPYNREELLQAVSNATTLIQDQPFTEKSNYRNAAGGEEEEEESLSTLAATDIHEKKNREESYLQSSSVTTLFRRRRSNGSLEHPGGIADLLSHAIDSYERAKEKIDRGLTDKNDIKEVLIFLRSAKNYFTMAAQLNSDMKAVEKKVQKIKNKIKSYKGKLRV